ncbi:5-methylcytosine-specific restriction endonuclease McrA [Mesoflavibacter sabulilitoris]|uniref:HNH endonuclease n=1 Tax=Mesoflavibacter zeaxanthinifaciens TaxID=393060 RepID=UPI00181314CB|nr:hypothetical protein [Mesoflavibacter zeaxanthinifaciens]MBB3124533.1 5-methylcytosine-specific restriction endonuclease McrA [Mesoflavibacter zeaxanthinifaciens subsp. sabulilitoris]
MKYKIQKKKNLELLQGQHGSYGKLLFDKRWRDKRTNIIKRDNNLCRSCGVNSELEVHHRQYHFIKRLRQFKKPWEYEDHLLITFCGSCHKKGHQKFKVPIKYI